MYITRPASNSKHSTLMVDSDGQFTNIQIKLGWALFVTYTIIQSSVCVLYSRSEMCSLHLTHPSVHTWSSGQPTVQHPGSSRGLPVGAGIRTHNLGLPRVSSPTLYPLGQRLPNGVGSLADASPGTNKMPYYCKPLRRCAPPKVSALCWGEG